MNLFKAIEIMKNDFGNEKLARAIGDCIEDRQGFLEDREPESEGEIHDLWEEKCDEWCEVLDNAQSLVDAVECYASEMEIFDPEEDGEEEKPSPDDVQEAIEELVNSLEYFQSEFGGISRLKVEV